MLFAPDSINAQTPDRPSQDNYNKVLDVLQDEISFLNDEMAQNPGSDHVEHNSDLISYYELIHETFSHSGDIYSSIAYGLFDLAYAIDSESNLYQNIFNQDIFNQSSGSSTSFAEESSSSGSTGGQTIDSDDDMIYSYNYVRDQFKSFVDAIDLVSGDASEFSDLLSFIRESR